MLYTICYELYCIIYKVLHIIYFVLWYLLCVVQMIYYIHLLFVFHTESAKLWQQAQSRRPGQGAAAQQRRGEVEIHPGSALGHGFRV